ncbi:PAS domain S-box protein [Mucilaginibacter sp. X4EP1]|uniref:PAS domain S-box protein n=1 Tax=Mucilaginibacter sp. X4EP1 TaxID=2723092 RepID=UPI00216702A6|nr:PAS domain S-box protein [Mucilaginibacter sp. X4EP1]MCS3815146.1 PAS domain S-box-containing protein [Mucilaginibacter sp. X4EP1]
MENHNNNLISGVKYRFLAGGGEMGALIRTRDWNKTSLGDPGEWPQSLKTALSIVLNSKFAMYLFWGSEFIGFYNDAYRNILGENGKHPFALGAPAKIAWEETWEFVEPLINQVFSGGDATWDEDQLVPIYRNGKMENIYATYSFSPVKDEAGSVAGVFVTCAETTEKVDTQKRIERNERARRLIIEQAHVAIAIFYGPQYTVQVANKMALALWGRDENEVLNVPILQAMPELESQGIKQLLDDVYKTGKPFSADELPIQLKRKGKLETVYINFAYQALYNTNGEIDSIITIGSEVTSSVLARKRVEESESRFRNMVKEAPVALAIIKGADLIFESINDEMLNLLSKSADIIGKPYLVALPEMTDQPYFKLLADAYATGKPIAQNEAKAMIERDGKLIAGYYNYIYQPITNENGNTTSVMAVAIDVTEQVVSRNKVQELNEELATINEELSSSNEEINAANEELSQSQKILQALNDNLSENENLLRTLIKQAPVGICLIRSHDLVVMEVNDYYLELVGKPRAEIEKRSIWDALPEAADAYKPIMDKVIVTATAFKGKEHELVLVRNGVPEKVILDFVYEPVVINNEAIEAVMVLAIDVTDKVQARHDIEEMEERVRLAIEAAEIGTFDLDLVKQDMLTSPRFDNIFGFEHHVSWKKFVDAIHPDDKETRIAAHEIAILSGKLFYEVRVIYKDNSIHWLRIQGQVYYDSQKQPVRILGTVLDITQFKRLQQQKDDFISIASHELKTPITTLKASLQMLDKIKDRPSDLLPKLIDQSNKSMQKISTLVEDLLNVSRASETQLKLKKTNFVMADMLNVCCSHIRIAGKFHLIVQGDEKWEVCADEHAIDQVMVNLVNNAIKYAPDSLDIILKVEKVDNDAKISVIDFGPGIPAVKLPHLFDRYYQADASGFQKSGLGLGLYISAEIVKRHGGKIGADSELGKGATFWFTLPL